MKKDTILHRIAERIERNVRIWSNIFSQRGNKLFPGWEKNVPSVGITTPLVRLGRSISLPRTVCYFPLISLCAERFLRPCGGKRAKLERRLTPHEITAHSPRHYGSYLTTLRLVVILLLMMVVGVNIFWI